MRPVTSSARARRAARRLAHRLGGTAGWKPVGTRWRQPREQPSHLQGLQVRGCKPKGVRTRSRRARQRKRRFSTLQQRRQARNQRLVRNAALRSSSLYEGRTGLQVMRKDRKGFLR